MGYSAVGRKTDRGWQCLKFRIEIMAAPENANQLKSTVSVYKDDELVAYLENQLELVLAG